MSNGRAKIQLYLFAVYIFNVLYNCMPTFALKRRLLKSAGIRVGDRSYIHTPVKFFSLGNLHIGDNTTVNPRCFLDARARITIGNNVNIAHNTKIYTLGHDVNANDLPLVGKEVRIEDDVFVFANVLVMPGVTIGQGAVVFPGSVVAKDVAPFTIVGGNPAKYIKDRSRGPFVRTDYSYWFAQ